IAATQAPQPTAAGATAAPTEAGATAAPTAAAQATAAPTQAGGFYDGYFFPTAADYQAATGKTIDTFHEAPSLADQVAGGSLPALADRLPTDVAIVRT